MPALADHTVHARRTPCSRGTRHRRQVIVAAATVSNDAFLELFPSGNGVGAALITPQSRDLIDWWGSSGAALHHAAAQGMFGSSFVQATGIHTTYTVLSFPTAADTSTALEAAKPPAGCTQGEWGTLHEPENVRGQDNELVGDPATLPTSARPTSFPVEFSVASGLGRGVNRFFAHGRLLLRIRATERLPRADFQKLAGPALPLLLA